MNWNCDQLLHYDEAFVEEVDAYHEKTKVIISLLFMRLCFNWLTMIWSLFFKNLYTNIKTSCNVSKFCYMDLEST